IRASEAPGRWPNYRCPTCGAQVHLRQGAQRTYFAHDPGKAKPECKFYYPGQGDRTPAQPALAVEGVPTEPGLCLTPCAPGRAEWGLFLRLPELDAADVAGVPLGALATARVTVGTSGREVGSLLAIFLRAGVGVGRV